MIDLSHLLDGCDGLAELDLSSLSTASATDLTGLLPAGGALERVTLGGAFTFAGAADAAHAARMPEAPDAPPHTGRWVLEGTPTALAAAEIEESYDPSSMAGTWSWEVGWAPLALDLAGGREPAATDEGDGYPAWYRLGERTPLPGTEGSDLDAPTRPGFAFAGWADEDGEPVEAIGASSTGTRALVATWEVVQVRVTVPVAITLEGTPASDGTLRLAAGADEDAAVTNDGETDVVASLALAAAPASLVLEIAAEGDGVRLSDAPREVCTLGPSEGLPLAGLAGSVGAQDVSDDVPVARLAWTFAVTE